MSVDTVPASSPGAQFRDQLESWIPDNHLVDEQRQEWVVNPNGSITITLPSVIAANLADEFLEWEQHGACWVTRPECQNWKRSPIARENRRETIVYGNVLESMEALLGRRQVRSLMARITALTASNGGSDV